MNYQRIKEIRKNFSVKKFESLLVSSVSDINYLTNFSGFSKNEREAFILLTKQSDYLFTDGRYDEVVKNLLPDFKIIQISAHKNFFESLAEIIAKEKIRKMAVNENDLSMSEYKKISHIIKISSDEKIVIALREIKDDWEIRNIKTACKLTDHIFKLILPEIKPEITEIELAKKIEMLILSKNSSPSFSPIVAFGSNSSSPHHVPSTKKLSKNKIVLLDFGITINGYCSDMTRTVFMGSAPAEFRRIYQTVLTAQTKAIKFINHHFEKNIKACDIDQIAREHIISRGYPTIPHSLGHGIGLDVHEKPSLSPNSKDIIRKGMIFSVEPGIYLLGFGGVRIEDLVIFDGKNPHLLSHANKQIIEL